jgi:hypothetical protein
MVALRRKKHIRRQHPILLLLILGTSSLLSFFFFEDNTTTTTTTTTTKITVAASTVPVSVPFHPQVVKKFVHYKCQNPLSPSCAIWSWEGRLVDPTSGKIIANVEGIELVRILSEVEQPPLPSPKSTQITPSSEERTNSLWRLARGLRRLHDLKVKNMLTTTKTTGRDWDYAGTVLSRKLFCYSPPTDGDQGRLLTSFKHNANSPIKDIGTEESIALYDTATTFISRFGGREMEVVTEWPDGRWIQSNASAGLVDGVRMRDDYYYNNGNMKHQKNAKEKFPFGFTTYVKRSGRGEIPLLPKAKDVIVQTTDKKSNKKTVIPRSTFIQFGKDEDSEHRRFGARETYSYIMGGRDCTRRSNRYKRAIQETISDIGERIGLWDFEFEQRGKHNDDTCTVQYTRYGEAPPWYAPGRMCTLELLGRRVDSVTDAPPLAATVAATRIPGFMSVHTPIAFGIKDSKKKRGGGINQNLLKTQQMEDASAINTVKWFRGVEDKSLALQILPEGDYPVQDMQTRLINGALNAVQRIRAATTLNAATEI